MKHPNQIFTHQNLLDRVWKADASITDGTIRTQIKMLRKKLDGDEKSIIRTVHGTGYKLEN